MSDSQMSGFYPTKERVPLNSSTVSVTAAIGSPHPEMSSLYSSVVDNQSNDPIYIDDEMIQFPENIMFQVSLHGSSSCIQDIVWTQSPIYADMLEDSISALQSDHTFDRIGIVRVAKVKIGDHASPFEDSDVHVGNERWYVLNDGTHFHEYKSCMKNEEDMKDWWKSNRKCIEMEKKDMKYHRSLGVRFTADHIPTPESLSRKDIGIVYRGEPTNYYVPVYSKIQDDRSIGIFLYRHIWTRTLLKYRAYYRVVSDGAREIYMYGGDHVYFKSGRRLIGNPWHNRISNQYVLGIPYEEGDLHRPCTLWQWYFDRESNGWINIPFNE